VDLLFNSNQVYIKEYMWNFIPLRTLYAWSWNSAFRVRAQPKDHQFQLTIGNDAQEAVLLVTEEIATIVMAGVNLLLQQKLSSNSFPNRVQVLRKALVDKASSRVVYATIDRNKMLRDGCKFLLSLTDSLEKVCIQFKGEIGIDAGGLSKEFFSLIQQELFLDSGLFVHAKFLITQMKPDGARSGTQREELCVLPNSMINAPVLEGMMPNIC
jgi:hypothetical protein